MLFLDASHPVFDPATTELLIGFTSIAVVIIGSIVIPLSLANRGKIRQTAEDARVVRYQVENSHDSNLRDDADEKHDASTSMQDRILDGIKELRTSMDRQFGEVRKDIQRLNDHDDRDDKRIRDLEATQPSKTVPRKPRRTT